MKDLTDTASTGAASVLSGDKDAAGHTVKVVKDAAERARGRAAELGSEAYGRSREIARQFGEEPVRTALIAGTVGVLIGFLLARR